LLAEAWVCRSNAIIALNHPIYINVFVFIIISNRQKVQWRFHHSYQGVLPS
jgi:hypothetical protein